jgi:ADP-ribosylglycohydrolase
MTTWPTDYVERVYAGVLGKIIGVYVGRPFEGWTHERIVQELGEVEYYVHGRLNKPLIVADDDISGTFTFLRAMPDQGVGMSLTPAQIGETWLNYLIENRTVLWWGGMGMSTEHTAYLRLKQGISAPASGSIALNGQVVAEQIGAQIFIDGWGLICPGDPERATDLARRAASVSHDGEAIYGAQIVAALVAQAFVESGVPALLDTAVAYIPRDSLIYRLIGDVREWHARYPSWYDTFHRIQERYGYHRYGGNCHIVPNHAVVIMSLLYSGDDFSRGLTVVNTAGWDTDCNSANVGCILGVAHGLAGIEAGPDWRGPVADRMVLPTADTGRAMTDAASEAIRVAAIGCQLAGMELPQIKGGARYHFELPGSVQGWLADDDPACRGVASLRNAARHSLTGTRSLAIDISALAPGRCARVRRETYPDLGDSGGYGMVASPTLYTGQTLRARLEADGANSSPVHGRIYVQVAGGEGRLMPAYGPAFDLLPGEAAEVDWRVSVPEGCPICWVGLEFTSEVRLCGTVYLDTLTWDGEPDCRFGRATGGGQAWLKAWTAACSVLTTHSDDTYRMIQNEGRGLMIQGTREWRDYAVEATLTANLARCMGVAARVQGLRRYYSLELAEGSVRLVRHRYGATVLASRPFDWELYRPYRLSLTVHGDRLVGRVDDVEVFDVRDDSDIRDGAIAIVLEEGRIGCEDVSVRPA